MKELMYGHSSGLIVSGLFLCMLLFLELGYRLGRRRHVSGSNPGRAHVGAVLAAMLGLLALLLGFTFSLALQRYDHRSQAVVVEANAIEATYLSARLLPIEMRSEVQALLRRYLDVRIREGRLSLAEDAKRDALNQQANGIVADLWAHAERAVERDARPVASGRFVQSLNELIDASGARNAASARHVPEIVLLVMFAAFVLTGATLGYDSGVAGHRPMLPAYALILLIVVVVYLIMDLDRPQRGVIRVSQESLLDLQQVMGTAPVPTARPGSPPEAPRGSPR
jgi:hypothetical protein